MSMEKEDYSIIGFLILIGVLLSIANPTLPSQNILPPSQIVSFTSSAELETLPMEIPENPSSVAFQSIAFSASSFSMDLITLNEGVGPLMKVWNGLYVWMWLAAAGIIAVNVILSMVKLDIREIPEKNEAMNLINLVYILVPLFSYLALGYMYVTFSTQASVFYLIFLSIPIGFLAFMKRYNIGFNIAVNDKIGFIDVTSSTQIMLTVFAVFLVFFVLGITQTSYSAFAISGDTLSREAVVVPEDQALNYVPTMIMLLIGNVLWLSIIAIINRKEIAPITHVDMNYIFDLISSHSRSYFSGLVVIMLMIASFQGYVGAQYHIKAYSQAAIVIASNTGMSEEAAFDMITESVATFWSMGSLGSMICGNIFPMDIPHAYINAVASV